jgi:hypothetical protein
VARREKLIGQLLDRCTDARVPGFTVDGHASSGSQPSRSLSVARARR